MRTPTHPLGMTSEDREQLLKWVRARTTPQRVAFRARICLLAAEGLSNTAIAVKLNASRPTVLLWRKRYEEEGPQALTRDAPHGPSARRVPRETAAAILEATLHGTAPDGKAWSTRTLAEAFGVSNATISRIWKAAGVRSEHLSKK